MSGKLQIEFQDVNLYEKECGKKTVCMPAYMPLRQQNFTSVFSKKVTDILAKLKCTSFEMTYVGFFAILKVSYNICKAVQGVATSE